MKQIQHKNQTGALSILQKAAKDKGIKLSTPPDELFRNTTLYMAGLDEKEKRQLIRQNRYDYDKAAKHEEKRKQADAMMDMGRSLTGFQKEMLSYFAEYLFSKIQPANSSFIKPKHGMPRLRDVQTTINTTAFVLDDGSTCLTLEISGLEKKRFEKQTYELIKENANDFGLEFYINQSDRFVIKMPSEEAMKAKASEPSTIKFHYNVGEEKQKIKEKEPLVEENVVEEKKSETAKEIDKLQDKLNKIYDEREPGEDEKQDEEKSELDGKEIMLILGGLDIEVMEDSQDFEKSEFALTRDQFMSLLSLLYPANNVWCVIEDGEARIEFGYDSSPNLLGAEKRAEEIGCELTIMDLMDRAIVTLPFVEDSPQIGSENEAKESLELVSSEEIMQMMCKINRRGRYGLNFSTSATAKFHEIDREKLENFIKEAFKLVGKYVLSDKISIHYKYDKSRERGITRIDFKCSSSLDRENAVQKLEKEIDGSSMELVSDKMSKQGEYLVGLTMTVERNRGHLQPVSGKDVHYKLNREADWCGLRLGENEVDEGYYFIDFNHFEMFTEKMMEYYAQNKFESNSVTPTLCGDVCRVRFTNVKIDEKRIKELRESAWYANLGLEVDGEEIVVTIPYTRRYREQKRDQEKFGFWG